MTLLADRTRIRVHPLALLLPPLAARLGAGAEAAALLAGLFLHEGAHLLAARWMGVDVEQLRLMPFGGAIGLGNPYALAPVRLLVVALAGPAANLAAMVSCAALAHWGALPPLAALALVRANLLLMLFNLIPALPLDGGRALYAVLFPRIGRARAAETGILAGRAVAVALLALALWSWLARGVLNLSPVAAAVFIAAAGPEERRALSGVRAQALLRAARPVSGPVPVRLRAVSGDCTLREALRAASPSALTLYAVYEEGRLAAFTDDRQLLRAALAQPPAATVSDACEA